LGEAPTCTFYSYIRKNISDKERNDIVELKFKKLKQDKLKEGASVLGGYKSYKNNNYVLGSLFEL
jgi:hypothetical protein